MNCSNHLRLLARRWHVVGGLALLGTVTGYLAGGTAPPCFRATATMYVSLPSSTPGTAQPPQEHTLAQTRARSYAAVVASPAVVGPVVHQLGLAETPGHLARRIGADAPAGTALVHVFADDRSPAEAARIANAVARRFAMVVEDLDRPVAGGTAPVKVTVPLPAAVPSAPYLPRMLPDVVTGLLTGLVLGLMLALLLDGANSSVLGTTDAVAVELELIGGPPLLGSIPKDRRALQRPVAVAADPDGPLAVAFRGVRTSLLSLPSDRRPRVLAVTSALLGEGKTTTAVNLATALGESGASVCLVDADLRRPRVADTLGLVHNAGLTTVLIGQARLNDVLQSMGPFAVLTSGPLPAHPAELLGTEVMRRTMRELAESFDHVVVDTGPLLPVADAIALAPAVDGYLLVVRAKRTTRGDLSRSVRALKHTGTTLTGTVLNRALRRTEGRSLDDRQAARPIPSQRQRRPVTWPLSPPCGPTTHTTAPIPASERTL